MLLATLMTALAGNVYINNVRVEPSDLAGLELKSVNVKTDAQGNIWIDAPGYTVRPVDPNVPAPVPAQPVPMPAPPQVPGVVVPVPGPVMTAPRPTGVVTGPTPATAGVVPPAQWWLYVEDNNSFGHVIDVSINGVLATTVRSGGGQPVILDVGKWLRPGANDVSIRAMSTDPGGGPLYVYIGQGSDKSGTVDMGTPDIQFGVGRSRNGETSRSYTLEVK